MSDKTGISWTDATWNPIRGCTRVSEGCRHCYAETVAHRHGGPGRPYEGLTTNGRWNGTIKVVDEHLTDPLRWQRPRRVFVNSMSDLFHENVADETIDRIFAVMALSPRHSFQVLTKRPARMRAYLSGGLDRRVDIGETAYNLAKWGPAVCAHLVTANSPMWPLPNVWLGVSVEDQATADARIPLLLQTPAAVRFISAEPLLGAIDLTRRIGGGPFLDWVIVGGESGHGARPCWTPWVRRIVEQCTAAGVACFVKQLGANVRDRNDAGFMGDEPDHWPEHIGFEGRVEHDLDGTRDGYQGAPVRIHLHDRKGADMAEWPEDLRVRQFPEVHA
ncbi:DUF5131 family protein [Luteitalea sp.]